MDHSDILNLLSTDHYAPADLETVNDLCRNYPAFNLSHMLKVRIRKVLGYDKESDLKRAAVYACDRKALYQMVHEVTGPGGEQFGEESRKDEGKEPDHRLQFSEDPHQEADVIIEQHAPYAAPSGGTDLLELDEDASQEDASDQPSEEHPEEQPPSGNTKEPAEDTKADLSSETLIQAVVKEETDMEEPDPADTGTPAADKVEPEKDEDAPPGEDQSQQLIRDFINQDHGPIRADKETSLQGDASLSSVTEHDSLITDTLAQIYVKQGLYAKAIYAYERLSLKYPEKSAYFAAQIDKIKNINQS